MAEAHFKEQAQEMEERARKLEEVIYKGYTIETHYIVVVGMLGLLALYFLRFEYN